MIQIMQKRTKNYNNYRLTTNIQKTFVVSLLYASTYSLGTQILLLSVN